MQQGLAIFVGSIATILYLVHYLMRGGRKGYIIDKIPGPYAWPIIGNAPMFLGPLNQIWNLLRDLNYKYHGIYRLWMGPQPVVFLAHPDDVEALLTSSKHIKKSFFYKFAHPWLGTGLVTSSESAMGYTSSMDDDVLNEYRSCVREMGDLLTYRATRPWLYFDWSFRWTKKFVDQCRVLNVIHGFSTNIIKQRRQYHKDTDGHYLKGFGNDEGVYGYDDHDVNGKRRLAMLDLLISASQKGAGIDDEGIREEVDTFVFGGSDTTSTALSFALWLLAENKEIQDKARAEVDEVFGERRGEKMSFRDIQCMSYLERCIKESLRLFPGVPMISRRISEDLQLKNYLVPGGTTVAALIYDLHRNPNFWPNPTVFDPDRFLPERTQGYHPFAYVPFSAGPRNCIGQKFAMLELKALLGRILHKFYVEPIDLSSEVRFVPDMVLKPLTPVRIRLVRRSYDN